MPRYDYPRHDFPYQDYPYVHTDNEQGRRASPPMVAPDPHRADSNLTAVLIDALFLLLLLLARLLMLIPKKRKAPSAGAPFSQRK